MTVIAAAGNDGHTPVSWPAADPRVIAVGAVGRDLTRAPYSNYGPELDLVAPAGAGADVPEGYGPPDGAVAQTLKGGPGKFCFCFTASTSAAAAEVSAVAALLVGSGRASGPAEVRAALLGGARKLGRDEQYGAGLLQAMGALRVAAGQPATAQESPRGSSATADEDAGNSPLLPIVGVAFAGLLAGGLVLMARRRRAR